MSILSDSSPSYSSGSSPSISIDGTGKYTPLSKENEGFTFDEYLNFEERMERIRKKCFEWDFCNGFSTELKKLLIITLETENPEFKSQFELLCEIFFSFKSHELLNRNKSPKNWFLYISQELLKNIEKRLGDLSDKEITLALKMMESVLTRAKNNSKNIKNFKEIQKNFYKIQQIQGRASNFQTTFQEIETFFETTTSRAELHRQAEELAHQVDSLAILTPITAEQKWNKQRLCDKIGIGYVSFNQLPTRRRCWGLLCCL